MRDKNINKFTALVTLPVCALLMILTLMSAYYVAAESAHECHEEDCPICAALEVCEALLNRMGSTIPLMGIAAIVYMTYFRASGLEFGNLPERSLVDEKIRMNN